MANYKRFDSVRAAWDDYTAAMHAERFPPQLRDLLEICFYCGAKAMFNIGVLDLAVLEDPEPAARLEALDNELRTWWRNEPPRAAPSAH